jgi:hypothetical protein
MKVVFCYALSTVVQGFDANETVHFSRREDMEENSDKIWKVWKKNKLNSEKIWKIWKKSQLNSEMLTDFVCFDFPFGRLFGVR